LQDYQTVLPVTGEGDGMQHASVGIGDLRLHLPAPSIDSAQVIRLRGNGDAELTARLERAIEHSGQRSIRFPEPWEDAATMGAAASRHLLAANPTAVERLRFVVAGTETGLDHSKPLSAYIAGMLAACGIRLPVNHSNYQVQHACAGGMLALFGVAALLAFSPFADEVGLVTSSDIARYPKASTAEVTQGAGAASVIVERDPRLVSLEPGTAGYASRDVDDFFRPLGSEFAKVKGRYSLRCYREALETAFLDHCRRLGAAPGAVLAETDMFALHVPYHTLAAESLEWLVAKHLTDSKESAAAFLAERDFLPSIEPTRTVGNLYSGSIFLALANSLIRRFRTSGEGVVGKRILFASYGSGNPMLVFRGTIAPGAPERIAAWPDPVGPARQASFGEYDAWMDGVTALQHGAGDGTSVPDGQFFLRGIREDGYREYAFRG
jgi:hydroxymethylglutaryl-CoA synthase